MMRQWFSSDLIKKIHQKPSKTASTNPRNHWQAWFLKIVGPALKSISVKEFSDDVQRFLDGEQVEACPPSFAYRARKVGDDQYFVNWHEPAAGGFVTLFVDFPAERVCSSVLAGYATDDEQVFFHSAVVDRVEASSR